MKDSNYLIGLLTNISMSGAVRQQSWGGFKGWMLDLLFSLFLFLFFFLLGFRGGATISRDASIV